MVPCKDAQKVLDGIKLDIKRRGKEMMQKNHEFEAKIQRKKEYKKMIQLQSYREKHLNKFKEISANI